MSTIPLFVVGLDIGGTSIVAGVLASQDAQIKSRKSIPTESSKGNADGLRRITELIQTVIEEAGVQRDQIGGIGIGSTGPIDPIRGLIQNPYTLPNWDDLPIVEHLNAQFQLPTCLLGDCQAAALGEQWAGAGRGAQNMIYITVGTGIGGGLIMNGRLYQGVGFAAGEVGHQVIDINGPDCYCGAKGCWEMLASGPAIVRRAADNVPESSLIMTLAGQDRAKITALLVARAAEQGDPFAIELQNQTAFYLGVGLANLLNIFSPDVAVLGGGVMGSWPAYEPVIIKTVKSRGTMIPFEKIRIAPASLGLNAGITGAARGIIIYIDAHSL